MNCSISFLTTKVILHFRLESAKLCILRAHVPACLAWSRAHVLTSLCVACQRVLRAYVSTCLACLPAQVPCVLTCSGALRA